MVARFPRRLSSSPVSERDCSGPRLVQPTDNILTWPSHESPSQFQSSGQPLTAEVRIKRFSGLKDSHQSVAAAELLTASSSPADLVAALTQAMSSDVEFCRRQEPGDSMIVEIRLVI